MSPVEIVMMQRRLVAAVRGADTGTRWVCDERGSHLTQLSRFERLMAELEVKALRAELKLARFLTRF